MLFSIKDFFQGCEIGGVFLSSSFIWCCWWGSSALGNRWIRALIFIFLSNFWKPCPYWNGPRITQGLTVSTVHRVQPQLCLITILPSYWVALTYWHASPWPPWSRSDRQMWLQKAVIEMGLNAETRGIKDLWTVELHRGIIRIMIIFLYPSLACSKKRALNCFLNYTQVGHWLWL